MVNFHSDSINQLFDTILSLESREECYAFFEDLCTVKEVQDMAQRLQVAVLLRKGQNYQQIAKEASVSTATISRVNKCLTYGSGGYKIALDRLKEDEA
ncbi:MAG: helix-turn-helix domain-containing protein [Clostridia bacterium]|nr:helix-turn-helix domain-containing protein [Clostridia bacterium]MBQ8399015.1 helix-turn-helix domain-containing protein [Clostridia bacterium]